jgi:hypothetical protein
MNKLSVIGSAQADGLEASVLEAPPERASVGGETERGKTAHFTVRFADQLGAQGAALADAVLARCENDYISLQNLFGGITPAGLPFLVHIRPGSNGASHANCGSTEMFCDAFGGNDGRLESMLVVAEADEVFMANQNAGWNCGASNGEALSRVIAAELTGDNFPTAQAWLNSPRRNFVSQNAPTDQDAVSTGCAALFINYLRSQLQFSLAQIVQAGGATLSQTSVNLGRGRYPFEPFALLLELHFPSGNPAALGSDNPFPLPLTTVPLSGLVHLQGIGDAGFVEDVFAGTQGQSRRVEGFQLQFNPPIANLGLRYMAHVTDVGDLPWVSEGQFVGSRGQSRQMEGFAIQLTGSAAANHTVMYMAHLADIGDTGFSRDGQFCGTRGQSRRLEGLLVHVGPV